MTTQERAIPSPEPTPETEAYWSAASAGELMIGRCLSCREPHFYPRRYCPFCGGEAMLERAKGTGEVYSFSVMRRARTPYAVAYVRLTEGVCMMTGLHGCDLDQIRIGMPVEVVFLPTQGGQPAPFFAPAQGR
jgi:hypothetical protein